MCNIQMGQLDCDKLGARHRVGEDRGIAIFPFVGFLYESQAGTLVIVIVHFHSNFLSFGQVVRVIFCRLRCCLCLFLYLRCTIGEHHAFLICSTCCRVSV
jgi:hypothetical protein